MKQNIPLMYVIGGLMWCRFFVPVLALFYIASEVPLEQFTIIMSVFALATLVLEVPSGVVADLLGRRNTMLLGRFMYIVEIAILAFCNGFWWFLVAKVISGIGVSLGSGTGSAFLYDTLKKLGRKDEHKKISGNMFFVSNMSMAFVFIIGAYLFSINPKLPAFLSLPFITLGWILTFFLEEPYNSDKKLTAKNSVLHLKESLMFFKNSVPVKFLALYAMPIATVISITLSMSSFYFDQILIPVSMIGVVAFAGATITSFSSKRADVLEKKLGEKKSLYLIVIMTLLALFLMSLLVSHIGVFFYYIISVLAGFFGIVVNHYMNEHVKTSHRATMLSIRNLFDNIGVFLLFPLIGVLSENYSLQFAYEIFGIGVLFYFVLFAFVFRNVKIKFSNPV